MVKVVVNLINKDNQLELPLKSRTTAVLRMHNS